MSAVGRKRKKEAQKYSVIAVRNELGNNRENHLSF